MMGRRPSGHKEQAAAIQEFGAKLADTRAACIVCAVLPLCSGMFSFFHAAKYAEYIPMSIRCGRPTARQRLCAAFAFVFVVAAGPGGSDAAEEVAGPVKAEVLRVIDGDTIEIRAQIWLGLALTSHVRIRGIDTPEMRGACLEEKALAAAARDRLAELAGGTIRLANISDDKYFGRVLADVTASDGTDLGSAMLASGLARPYDGGTRGDWCPVGSITN